jgi:hypothetical protein
LPKTPLFVSCTIHNRSFNLIFQPIPRIHQGAFFVTGFSEIR